MNQNKLFRQTRIRLALWYAIVMGLILSLCGFGFYTAVYHAHWVTLDRELESVAGTLHDSIELKLEQPGRLEPVIQQLLPNICSAGNKCIQEKSSSKRHTESAINQRLTTLVGDLLLLARLDRQPTPIRQQCCLNDIVSDLIEEFAAMAFSHKVTLSSSIRVHQPLNIVGNCEQLYRLVSNLIVNAIQYTPKFSKVTVVLDCSDHHAVIQVQDTGIGIAQQDQGRIFDRFYRVNSDRSRSTGGSGLGLAIAMAIVLAHHGSLNVQSELGKGSTFTILLPKKSPSTKLG